MPRFFVPSLAEDTITLDREAGRHIARSLRCREGDPVELCDGRGTDGAGIISAIAGEAVTVTVQERRPSRGELPCAVTLYQALPKGDKLDLIVQKAVELGVSAIVPVLTSRCVSRPDEKSFAKKRERLQKIALEAAGQSGRGMVPEVRPLLPYPATLDEMAKSGCPVLFYERATRPLGEVLAPRPPALSLLVGAEGGFSPQEAEQAAAAGLAVCTMGPRILRCETAPLYALSAIGYTYENMR